MTTHEILPYITVFIYIFLRAFRDSIAHHDALRAIGYFFSKEAAEAPKKNWLHKYFPMLYDAWHLAVQLEAIVIIFALFPNNFSLFCIILVVSGLLFNFFYEKLFKP